MNVRLVDMVLGDYPMSGRLEVYIQNRWGSVCAVNGVEESVFGFLEASVVCRSIGFQGAAREPYPLQRLVDAVTTCTCMCMCTSVFFLCCNYVYPPSKAPVQIFLSHT